MSYRIAAVDVHKKMLAVVVTDVAREGEYQFERRKFGATRGELRVLAEWLVQQEVEEVVMESTAQYWKPVWGALERDWKPVRQKREGASKMSGTLHLCQAKSNRGPRGRKNDFADGERMIKRLVAHERGPDWGASARRKKAERVKWYEIKSAVIYRLEQQVKKEGGRGLLLEKYIVDRKSVV